MRALRMTVTTLATVAAILGSPTQTIRAARFRRAAQPAPRSEATRLTAGEAVERELANSDQHGYELDLRADQYASVTLDAHGIHAIAAVIGPASKTSTRQTPLPSSSSSPSSWLRKRAVAAAPSRV